MKSNFLSPEELTQIGFASVGRNVRISQNALFFSPERIQIGNNVRIDAFCILSAGQPGLHVGRNVHISAFTSILGGDGVYIGDFATISVRCSIFSSNDDYTGETMTNPTVQAELRGVTNAPVHIEQHAILGTGTIVLPGVRVGESAAIGAGSLLKVDVPPLRIAAGVPARLLGYRSRRHRSLAEGLLRGEQGVP
jgi:acetyltransferase-like isoleucine patch superfamily enzyme